jgi:hypothetical protein
MMQSIDSISSSNIKAFEMETKAARATICVFKCQHLVYNRISSLNHSVKTDYSQRLKRCDLLYTAPM